MHAKKLVLRGYVRPKRDYFLAVCIDLNLVVQGKTIEEALHSLKDAIEGYLEEISENPQLYKETIPRKSPRSFYFQYYWAYINTFCRKLLKSFKIPLRIKQHQEWIVEQYSVNYTGLQLV